jgi:hypothetical protein
LKRSGTVRDPSRGKTCGDAQSDRQRLDADRRHPRSTRRDQFGR